MESAGSTSAVQEQALHFPRLAYAPELEMHDAARLSHFGKAE
jgi:hypothetical protein